MARAGISASAGPMGVVAGARLPSTPEACTVSGLPTWSAGFPGPRAVSLASPRGSTRPASRRALPFSVRAHTAGGDGTSTASAAEPKWKQKLAAAEEHAQNTRQQTARLQEEYRRRQDAERRRAAGSGGGTDGVPPLESLPWVEYLTGDGKIADCSQPGAKASVYAIFDGDKKLQYVGVSRQVYQSMRLHFARFPQLCHWAKVQHFARPSRSALEGVRDTWISGNSGEGTVPGNDGGSVQHRWENAVDCRPLMTEEERATVETAAPGPPKAKARKEVARRVERELEEEFKKRQCTEVLRFDPKLKESCLLDLKSTAYAPDTAVPTDKPK